MSKKPEALVFADDRPMSTSDDLYQWAVDAENLIRAQHALIAELEDDLQFVERWAVHHGSKPSISAQEALSCIQHYPAIHEITKSYKDGKRPDTFNPYARIAELEATCDEQQAGIERLREVIAALWTAVPEGWKTVPEEPTQAMIDAMLPVEEVGYWAMYEAAIACAPEAPAHLAEAVPLALPTGDEIRAIARSVSTSSSDSPSPSEYVMAGYRAALAATQPAAQGMEARDAAFEAVRKAFCKLQRYSFALDSRGNVRRCADHCGNWVEFEAVHTLFEPQAVDAAMAAQAKQEAAAPEKPNG